MRPCASQRTPLLVFGGVSARITASRFRSCQRGGQWLGKLPSLTSCTRTCEATLWPRVSRPTNSHSSPASRLRSSKTAASPKGLPKLSSDASRRSTTRLCVGCMNQTEALRDSSPSVTSMSPSVWGTVTRSVRIRPALGSTTMPAPRQQMLSPSTFSPSSTMSRSKFCTVRKTTVHVLRSRAALALTWLLFRALFRGGPARSGSETWDACEGEFGQLGSGEGSAGASRRRGDQTREARSSVQARCAYQWRAILPEPSCRTRSLAHFGTIQVTWKYSRFWIIRTALSKALRVGTGLPFTSRITASVLTASPKTKPAWAA
mmetsp:Transcript_45255/g.133971  ORF Transcript_45255/g.133971 Transcript_45255/m.133971 type:complete len:318 (-) Transcript_45255:1189-2142(-)